MSINDANIVVDGQKAVAVVIMSGEIVKDGGAVDATCVIKTEQGCQKVVKAYLMGGGGSSNPYKFVDALPETGEEGYIYGVYTNKTRDGYAIIQMFVWVNNAWSAFGAFDVDIDADNILYKTAITIDANNVVTIDLGD